MTGWLTDLFFSLLVVKWFIDWLCYISCLYLYWLTALHFLSWLIDRVTYIFILANQPTYIIFLFWLTDWLIDILTWILYLIFYFLSWVADWYFLSWLFCLTDLLTLSYILHFLPWLIVIMWEWCYLISQLVVIFGNKWLL